MVLRPVSLLFAALVVIWPADSSAVVPVVPCEVVHSALHRPPLFHHSQLAPPPLELTHRHSCTAHLPVSDPPLRSVQKDATWTRTLLGS